MPEIKIEKRALTELRAAGEFALAGVAACYNTNSHDLGGYLERIAPGAFTRSLKERADVVATFNHDPSKVLGRTKSGTLTLSDSTAGLVWYCQLDKTNSDHANIYASVKRGDVSQCSFAFSIAKNGERWGVAADGKTKLRTLLDVDLIDVAAVTYPAYPSTSVDARKLAAAPVSRELRGKLDDLIWKSDMNRRLRAAMLKS